jgi:hypothetical protein
MTEAPDYLRHPNDEQDDGATMIQCGYCGEEMRADELTNHYCPLMEDLEASE